MYLCMEIVDGLVPNLSDPITCSFSIRRGRTYGVYHAGVVRVCTIRMLSSCYIAGFKSHLDSHLRNIVDLPCRTGFINSLDGADCFHGGHYADDLAAN